MRIYGTLPSHFTRKVRVLLQELRVPFEFVPLADIMATGPENFVGNPLHMFPVMEDGSVKLIESDLICQYICEKYGRDHAGLSSFMPSPEHRVRDQQRLAIMNGGMAAGVTLIRAKRSGIENWTDYVYFRQELASIEAALGWLDRELGEAESFYPGRLTMLDIALMCFVEWAVFREFLKNPAKYPNVDRFVSLHQDRESFMSTHPSAQEARK